MSRSRPPAATRPGPRPPRAGPGLVAPRRRPPAASRSGARAALRLLPLVLSLAATVWAVSANPFAAPMAERGTAELRAVLDRQVARVATEAWLAEALAAAVAAGEADRAARLLALADELGRAVPRGDAEALIAEAGRPLARARACGACIADPGACESLTLLAACSVPFELSPLGDAAALGRAGSAWAAGAEVDRLEAGLATLGLGATAATLATGGAAAGVKAGAGLLRTARRMDALSPRLAGALAAPGGASVAADLARIRSGAGTAATLRLLPHVGDAADAARLARVSEALGPRTLRAAEVLGPSRMLRATTRLTRTAAGALALIWLTVTQAALLLAGWVGGALWRAALGPPRAR